MIYWTRSKKSLKMIHFKQKKFVSETVGSDILIIDHQQGLLITLNQTSSFVWNLLKTPKTKLEIIEKFSHKYGKDKSEDAKTALRKLLASGVIVKFESD